MALAASFTLARGGPGGGPGNSACDLPSIVKDLPYEELSAAERDGVIYMIEEEKLARDVYLAMDDLWGLRVFRNIARAEQSHMDAVFSLIEKYGLPDPVGDNGPGEFTNPDLAALYNQLIEQGSQSINDALLVGATIEDMDISDLQVDLPEADNEDVRTVYQNLMKGSRNHLRSFYDLLQSNGVDYTPQYLSQADFDAIVSSPKERGMLDADGNPMPGCSGPAGRGGGRGRGGRR
ncbi:MAG: DUF2202 domain-containing protein [Acidobacteriota bacterium]|nr:DUF2202 domain-containing protein [Acidobacteriota bacterium]